MIEAALFLFTAAIAMLVGGLLVLLGYHLARPGEPTAPRNVRLPAVFQRKEPQERRRPVANSDERAWHLEQRERERSGL